MCLIAGAAMAQEETLTLKAVKKGEEPKEVMDAIKQDFPQAIAAVLAFLPDKLYGEKWSIDLTDNLDGDTPNFYQVNLKEKNQSYQAVYDKTGKVLYSKTVIEQAKLPKEVMATVSAKYPGWNIVKDTEKITVKQGGAKEVFRVEIKQEKKRRSLFLDYGGKLIKDVSAHHLI